MGGNVKFSVSKRGINSLVDIKSPSGKVDLGRKIVKNVKSIMEEEGIISKGSACHVGLGTVKLDEKIDKTFVNTITLTDTSGQRRLDGKVFVSIDKPDKRDSTISNVSIQLDFSQFKRLQEEKCC